MEPADLPIALASWAESHGVAVDETTADRLAAYIAALLEEGQRINLTAARDLAKAWEVLVRPSLAIALAMPDGGPERALDLGTGNGFPGIAVAALWPEAEVVLMERRERKAEAVARIVRRAGLDRVRVVKCDAREVKNEAPALLAAMDLVTVRAVGPLGDTTRMAAPLLAPGGRVVHWKRTTTTPVEMKDGARAARAAKLAVMPPVAPDAKDSSRLIVYRRALT